MKSRKEEPAEAHAMAAKLERSRGKTTVVAYTGTFVRRVRPLERPIAFAPMLEATRSAAADPIQEVAPWARSSRAPMAMIADDLAISFGAAPAHALKTAGELAVAELEVTADPAAAPFTQHNR